MFAYADSKMTWGSGYLLVCKNCILKAPAHVDTTTPVAVTPAMGKRQRCNVCNRFYDLQRLGSVSDQSTDKVAMPSCRGPLSEIVRRVLANGPQVQATC